MKKRSYLHFKYKNITHLSQHFRFFFTGRGQRPLRQTVASRGIGPVDEDRYGRHGSRDLRRAGPIRERRLPAIGEAVQPGKGLRERGVFCGSRTVNDSTEHTSVACP